MSSLNFIGGEKDGVGKSVTARVLAQYFIDHSKPFVGFDTDRSHSSFTRFYEGFASPVVVDSYEGLDTVVNGFETRPQQSVIVDLAAQTLAPLARWIKDSDLFAEFSVTINFWHVLSTARTRATCSARWSTPSATSPTHRGAELRPRQRLRSAARLAVSQQSHHARGPRDRPAPPARRQHAQDRCAQYQLLESGQRP
jgi:hypothetical protein